MTLSKNLRYVALPFKKYGCEPLRLIIIQIQQTLNVSLIGDITMIKNLLQPQLRYLFSVLFLGNRITLERWQG